MDYRKNQKVIATIEIEDRGQDFIELDILANGVILGQSVIFENGRLSLVGIGSLNGTVFKTVNEIVRVPVSKLSSLKGCYVYFYKTAEPKPLPWDAETFKYAVTRVKKGVKPNRFIKK